MRISDWSSDVCSSDLCMATTTEEVAPAFAQFTAGTTFDSLPDPVVERVKKSILDVLGVGVYGSDYPAVKAPLARKSVVSGKRVSVRLDIGGSRIIKKKKRVKKETNIKKNIRTI